MLFLPTRDGGNNQQSRIHPQIRIRLLALGDLLSIEEKMNERPEHTIFIEQLALKTRILAQKVGQALANGFPSYRHILVP
ncbi:MAG: hypothetical protein ABSG98_12430 [Anaerolineales bacterium]|jgi:hypothetical protein